MGKALVHGGLHVETPPTFVEMTADEMKQDFGDDNPHRWGARDMRHHRMFVIMWQDSNALLAKFVSTNALIKRVEKLSSKGYADHGYQAGSYSKRTICGLEAEGFDFSYEVQGVSQHMYNYVFKHGKTCYTLYWVERAGGGTAGKKAREAVLDALALEQA